MALIRVDTDRIAAYAQHIKKTREGLERCLSAVSSARASIEQNKVPTKLDYSRDIKMIEKQLQDQLMELDKMERMLYKVIDQFTASDSKVGSEAKGVRWLIERIAAFATSTVPPRSSLAMAGVFAGIMVVDRIFKWPFKGGGGDNFTPVPVPKPPKPTAPVTPPLSVWQSSYALKPYTGTNNYKGNDYSDFLIINGFKEEYSYSQRDPSWDEGFTNEEGKNRGCTATSNAIVVSIANNEKFTPNQVKWSWPDGYTATGIRKLEDSIGLDKDEKLRMLGDELLKGNPVYLWANDNHAVAAVGIRNGADMSKLEPSDILIVDPYDGKIRTLDLAENGGYKFRQESYLRVAT